ncbi:11715_t:CDS:2, partial [Gigaspora margarita]
SLIKEYLTPHILSLQQLQLSESFLYDANEVSFDWNNILSEPENIMENGYLEDDYEQCQWALDFQKSVSKKVRWSKGHGLVKKALGLMIWLNCDDEFIGMVKKFISSKTHELQLFDKEKSVVEPQPAESEPAVANLFVTKRHGHPPNRLKNVLENVTNTHQNTHSSSNATLLTIIYKKEKETNVLIVENMDNLH